MTTITNDTLVRLLATNDDPLTFGEFVRWNAIEPDEVAVIAAGLAESGEYRGRDESGMWVVEVVENSNND